MGECEFIIQPKACFNHDDTAPLRNIKQILHICVHVNKSATVSVRFIVHISMRASSEYYCTKNNCVHHKVDYLPSCLQYLAGPNFITLCYKTVFTLHSLHRNLTLVQEAENCSKQSHEIGPCLRNTCNYFEQTE